jgi:hypothetical protein
MDNEDPQEPEQQPWRFGPHGLAFPSELLSENGSCYATCLRARKDLSWKRCSPNFRLMRLR